MTKRLIIGRRGAEMGMWLSIPGVDVLTAGDDELLISPTNPRLAFMMTGLALVNRASSTTVALPITLTDPPVVFSQLTRDTLIDRCDVPVQYDRPELYVGFNPRHDVEVDQVTFFNSHTNFDSKVRFLVAMAQI